MKELNLKEIQTLELEILTYVADYCDAHGLRCFLAFGTLLGAVRHKGFIPWDDDVDLIMPREDYHALIREFNREGYPRFRLISPEDPLSRHSFVKVIDTGTVKRETNFDYAPGDLGVDIDIFPLDGQPEDMETFRAWSSRLRKYYCFADFPVRKTHDCRRKNLLLGLINGLGGRRHLLGVAIKRRFQKKAEKLHNRYPLEGTRAVGVTAYFYHSLRDRYDPEWFREAVLLEFEGHLFKAPVDYARVLEQDYGDYMTLPPEDQRQGHLLDEVYRK